MGGLWIDGLVNFQNVLRWAGRRHAEVLWQFRDGRATTLNWLEAAAVMLGLINVCLIIGKSALNFPFGIAMVAIYFGIFFEARLYSEALLQIFFVVVQIYGWTKWHSVIVDQGQLAVAWSDPPVIATSLAATVLFAAILGTIMAHLTNAVAPYIDATVTAGSVVAQLLLSFRRIESWLYWIAVDVLSIALYLTRGLTMTAGLYGLFLVLAVAGLLAWRRQPGAQAAVA